MRVTMKLAAGVLGCLSVVGASHAAAPTYSGEWLLQLKNSGGRARVYAGNRLQIEDTGKTWNLKSWRNILDEEQRGWEISGSLDGSACKVDYDAQAGNSRIGTLSCKLYREGEAVVLELNRDVARTTQRFAHSLSADGQMTVTYQAIEHYGDGRDNTIVDTRQNGAEVYKKS